MLAMLPASQLEDVLVQHQDRVTICIATIIIIIIISMCLIISTSITRVHSYDSYVCYYHYDYRVMVNDVTTSVAAVIVMHITITTPLLVIISYITMSITTMIFILVYYDNYKLLLHHCRNELARADREGLTLPR